LIYTVAKVSELVNLSKASIYNKLKLKEFESYITKKQGITYISEDGFKLIQSDLKYYKGNNTVNEEIATDTDFINTLKENISYLKEQAKQKDLQFNNQLKEKDRQLENYSERLNQAHKLIENNQILLKEKPKQEILLLEEHFQDLDNKFMDIKKDMQERKEPQKGFLKRMLKK
jgi:Fe2+ transport system protein B